MHMVVPPGFIFAGATLKYIIPQDVPADGVVQIPIVAENIVSGLSKIEESRMQPQATATATSRSNHVEQATIATAQ